MVTAGVATAGNVVEEDAGPIMNPVDRFAHLPEPTRKWLETLREDDLAEINDAIKFYRTARTLGRFGKWSIISAVAFFITVSQLGEAVQKIWTWFGHWGRP